MFNFFKKNVLILTIISLTCFQQSFADKAMPMLRAQDETKISNENNNQKPTTKILTEDDITEIIRTEIIRIQELYNLSDECTERLFLSALKKISENTNLKAKQITGFCVAFDGNVGLIWDTQNPQIRIYYKTALGKIKFRDYQISVTTLGLKGSLNLQVDFIYFTGPGLNFENRKDPILLGYGVELSVPYYGSNAGILYSSLVNQPGGMYIASVGIGLQVSCSIVTGGELKPVK